MANWFRCIRAGKQVGDLDINQPYGFLFGLWMLAWCSPLSCLFRMVQSSVKPSCVPLWSVLMVPLLPMWQESVAKNVSVSTRTHTTHKHLLPLLPCTHPLLAAKVAFFFPHTPTYVHTHRNWRYYSSAFHLTPPQGCLTTDHISQLLSYMLTVSPVVSSRTYTYPNKLFTSWQ